MNASPQKTAARLKNEARREQEELKRALGKRALRARRILNLSQAELAEKGIHGIDYLERGEHLPRADVLFRFSQLGINPQWLLTGKGPETISNLPATGEKASWLLSTDREGTPILAFNTKVVELDELLKKGTSTLLCMVAVDDAMATTICKDDVIFYRHDPDGAAPLKTGIYLLRIQGEETIRRLTNLSGQRIRLSYDSSPDLFEDFSLFDIGPDQFTVVGQVLVVVRTPR